MFKRHTQGADARQGKKNPLASVVLAALNIAIIAVMLLTVINYTESNRLNARRRNIQAATNASSAVTETVMLYFTNQQRMLGQQKHYIGSAGEMAAYADAVEYLTRANNDTFYDFQLLDAETFSGVSVSFGEEAADVAYNATGSFFLELQQAGRDAVSGITDDETLSIIPSFANPVNGMQSVAFYSGLRLADESGASRPYLLLLVIKTDELLGSGLPTPPYSDAGAAVISLSGDYIVKTGAFKSTNIYEYFRGYSGLSYPEIDEMRAEVTENGTGYYFLNDHRGQERIFVFNSIGGALGWTYFSSIPLSAMEVYSVDYVFAVIVVGFVLLLAVVDAVVITVLNIRLKRSLADARRASVAKGSFMSNMSHEIRTPLNAIIGYNSIARDEMAGMTGENRAQAQMSVVNCLDKSEVASRHLLTIINDVLDMSAIESGKIKIAHDKFDFNGLISSISTVFYSQARSKGVDFEVIFDAPTGEWLIGDSMRTSQILTNLLSNAIKFTAEGGNVALKISHSETEAGKSLIRFEVSDTGIGMTEDYLKRIWEPFEQADSSISRRFGGTGLGLSITKNFIDLMGGKIGVQSVPGKGTTFTVEMTFDRAEAEPSAKAYDFSAINALVADENETTGNYIRLLFERCGVKCATVFSGAAVMDAISVAMKSGAPYTLCILDWRMPEIADMKLARDIRALAGNEVPEIVISAYDSTEISGKAAEAGISRFISKPLFQSALFDMLVDINGVKDAGSPRKRKEFHLEGVRVLLAEDNAMNMEIAKRLMVSAGLVVDGAWNGREAVDMFMAALPGTYQAIFMDIHMPELNGLDAARAIRTSNHPEAATVPIIAMTADAFAENVAEALDAGMNGHLSKPINFRMLFAELEKYINK